MRFFLVRSFVLMSGLCLLSGGHPTFGQDKTDTKDPLARDPAAITLRDKMTRAYRSLRSYREKVTQKQWKSSPEDASVIEIEFRFRKPNRLLLNVDYPNVGKPGRWHLTWACDGKHLIFYNSARNEYRRIKAPDRLDKLILANSLRGPEFETLLRDTDPFENLDKNGIVRYSASFEQQTQGAQNILTLNIQQESAKRTLQYRLNPKDNLLRGLSLHIVPEAGGAGPFLDEEQNATVEAEYTLVEANPSLPDADFAFTPPDGAKEKVTPAAEPSKRGTK